MALVARDGSPFSVAGAVFWAMTWGVGVAAGVALGGWLTLVGGAGAPGAEALEPLADLVVLPALAGGSVALIHLVGQVIASALRGRRAVSPAE